MKKLLLEIGVLIATVALSLAVSFTSMGQVIGLKIQDSISWFHTRRDVADNLVYVNIDDSTIDRIKMYPIPRVMLADAVKVIKEFDAEAIIIDSEFIDPAPMGVNEMLYEQGSQNVEELLIHQDVYFGEALAEAIEAGTSVYLACRGMQTSKKERAVFHEDNADLMMVYERFFLPIEDTRGMEDFFDEKKMEFPVFPLFLYSTGLGDVSAYESLDGILRQKALLRHFHGRYVPHLSFVYVLDALGIDKPSIRMKNGFLVLPSEDRVYRIPVNRHGEMLINWIGSWETQPWTNMISLADLLLYKDVREYLAALESAVERDEQRIAEAREALRQREEFLGYLSNKVVVIGYTATATTDVGTIPFDPSAPRVMAYVHLLNTILTESFLFFADWWRDGFFVGVLLVLVVLLSQRTKSALQEVAVLGGAWVILFGWMIGSMVIWGRHTHAFFLILLWVLVSVFYIVYKFILFDKQKQFIKQAFSYYLSPVVIKQLLSDPSQLQLGGEQREITAFFSDVEGFTSISEQLTPQEVVHLLNEYLTAATDILLKYGGTVDKFEGDAIVAFFGAPVVQSDHAYRCCMATLEIQLKLGLLAIEWVQRGYPLLKTRIGMNSGLAVVGNMGSYQRMNYTMMGDTVNLAARLESANKFYGTYTMISDATYEQVKSNFVCRKLDLIRVKGKAQPIGVYEIMGQQGRLSAEKQQMLERFNEACALYEKRYWEEALNAFRRLWEEYSDPPSKTYLERCEEFMKNPPPNDWNGVYVLKSK